jgi:hypothetical protein
MTDEMSDRQLVEELTRGLRSDDPYWRPISSCLAGVGVDPQTAWLVDLWPEDVSMEHGIVVSARCICTGTDL